MRIIRITAPEEPHPVRFDEWPVIVIVPDNLTINTRWPYYELNSQEFHIRNENNLDSRIIIFTPMDIDDEGIKNVLRNGEHNLIIKWRHYRYRLWAELNEPN